MSTAKFFFTQKERTTDTRQKAEEFGVTGEQIARHYLEDKGYVILDRNYHDHHREVDIIALDNDVLVFVEVKTRSSCQFMQPEDAVDHSKRERLIKAANQYILSHKRDEPLRFDIITIVSDDGKMVINHIKNAFNIMSF